MKSPMWNKLFCSAHGLTCAVRQKSSAAQEESRIYEEFDLCGFLRKEFVSPVQEFQCCHWGLDLTQGGKWETALQNHMSSVVLCGQQYLGNLGMSGKLLPWFLGIFGIIKIWLLFVLPLWVMELPLINIATLGLG